MNIKYTLHIAALGVAAVVIPASGCRKVIDKIGNGQVDCKECNIRQITLVQSDELGKDTVVYSFSYNAAGDPLTVKNTKVATGNPNVVFRYDKYGRLMDMIRPYENGSYETWTKYTYNTRGQIVRDTQYIFGTYIDSVPVGFPQNSFWIHKFAYDELGRISMLTDSVLGPGLNVGGTSTFHYDARGNLESGAVYDNQLSFLRTNRIWMLVCNNYSVNNAFQATKYNEHGLPLAFAGNAETMTPVISLGGQYQFAVTYLCR